MGQPIKKSIKRTMKQFYISSRRGQNQEGLVGSYNRRNILYKDHSQYGHHIMDFLFRPNRVTQFSFLRPYLGPFTCPSLCVVQRGNSVPHIIGSRPETGPHFHKLTVPKNHTHVICWWGQKMWGHLKIMLHPYISREPGITCLSTFVWRTSRFLQWVEIRRSLFSVIEPMDHRQATCPIFGGLLYHHTIAIEEKLATPVPYTVYLNFFAFISRSRWAIGWPIRFVIPKKDPSETHYMIDQYEVSPVWPTI